MPTSRSKVDSPAYVPLFVSATEGECARRVAVAGRWGARTEDVLENKVHDLICSGQLALHKAQHQEATNWVAAYRRYVGGAPSASSSESGGASGSGSTSTGGYYLSSYPSASTIYCADDSEWRDLSKTCMRHYATHAAAHRAYPGYHLYQPG